MSLEYLMTAKFDNETRVIKGKLPPDTVTPQHPCPTCGCRLYKETGPCAGEAHAVGPATPDLVLVSRSFLEATPCPNAGCSDGMITNSGPDPVHEPCQWCEEKHLILSGAERVASSGDPCDALCRECKADGMCIKKNPVYRDFAKSVAT